MYSHGIAGSFLSSPPVVRTLKRAKAADVILVSVGVVGPESLLLEEGFITKESMDEAIADGAVGEVFGWYYDADGNRVESSGIHPIALTLEELRSAPRVIGVAAGAEKTAAIRGAIAAGILDELAIDVTLAEALLK